MSRQTFVFCPVAGKVVEKGQEAAARGSNGGPPMRGPQIVRDIAETQHPIDGRWYSSRRHYNDVTRAHGAVEIGKREAARMVERGPQPRMTGPTVRESLRAALERY